MSYLLSVYSKQQDEFARGFAIFLLLLVVSGALVFAVVYFAPLSVLTLIPQWMAIASFTVWPLLCYFAAIRLRNHKKIKSWIWSKEK